MLGWTRVQFRRHKPPQSQPAALQERRFVAGPKQQHPTGPSHRHQHSGHRARKQQETQKRKLTDFSCTFAPPLSLSVASLAMRTALATVFRQDSCSSFPRHIKPQHISRLRATPNASKTINQQKTNPKAAAKKASTAKRTGSFSTA